MTVVDPSTQLAHLIQRQIASVAGGPASRPSQRTAPSACAPSSVATLAAGRIRAIRADDPDRRGKALRVFLACVMQHAFSAQAVHDPSFAAMLDAVQQQMRDDPRIADAADALARVLVGEGER